MRIALYTSLKTPQSIPVDVIALRESSLGDKPPRTAPEVLPKPDLEAAVRRSQDYLLRVQKPEGYWIGELIVDATLVAAPRQSKTEDEKKAIKEGRIPEDWKVKPAKVRHKDRDARWTVKFSKAKERPDGTKPIDIAIPVFGCQNHVSIDRGFGFIRT